MIWIYVFLAILNVFSAENYCLEQLTNYLEKDDLESFVSSLDKINISNPIEFLEDSLLSYKSDKISAYVLKNILDSKLIDSDCLEDKNRFILFALENKPLKKTREALIAKRFYSLTEKTCDEGNLLHEAVINKDRKSLRSIINHGLIGSSFNSVINQKNIHGHTPFDLTALNGDLFSAISLQEAGATISAKESLKIHLKQERISRDYVNYLLNLGIEPDSEVLDLLETKIGPLELNHNECNESSCMIQ